MSFFTFFSFLYVFTYMSFFYTLERPKRSPHAAWQYSAADNTGDVYLLSDCIPQRNLSA